MRGWFADLFRLFWGLLYWNTRKSWFRLRRGRVRCPCQNPSDSGRALATGCEACASWQQPARFRRVCPLLVPTPDGLRCSVNTADVRPFWGVAARYYGSVLLGAYTIAVVIVFIFLRHIGYPVNILHVALPPLWDRVGQARGWYFMTQSQQAFAAGDTVRGMLYLANSYEFDPSNYEAGIALAKNYQAGQPIRSDEVFRRLLADHPDKRDATAQDWFRALLARGDFPKIATLARDQILASRSHANVWMRALFFSVRRLDDDQPLRELLAQHSPLAAVWHPLIEVELHFRAGRTREARAAVSRRWPADSPPFSLFYRVNALIEFHDSYAALDLLAQHPGVLDAEAELMLRLAAYVERKATVAYQRQIDELFGPRLNPSSVKIICAHLIRHPDPVAFRRLCEKAEREALPFNTETAGAWFSLLCTAGAVGDFARLHELTALLKTGANNPFAALTFVESYFRGESAERRINVILPILPLPLEVTYALIDRYAPAATKAPAAPSKQA